jgi:excisionase family DNA binding protein
VPHANSLGPSNKPALLLADAAAYLGWSRRTLIRALVRHGIPTTGSGRRARLLRADLELLKAKEPGNIR